MEPIYNSATKIVFILIALALIGLTFTGKIEPKDFIILASMVFTYYFSKPQPNTQTTQISPIIEVSPVQPDSLG